MAHIVSYSHITVGHISREIWDEAWFAVESWKGFLQSFPGFMHVRLSARAVDDELIRFHSVTTWDYLEQLEEWRESQWSADALLKSLDMPAQDIHNETFEDLA